MRELTFKTGGQLEYPQWVETDENGEGQYVPCDVTDRAVAYLMQPVRFEGEIYVRDVFSLLDGNPVLIEIFSRTYAAEYLQESKKVNAKPYTGEYDPEGIEYLELSYYWEKDRESRQLDGVHHLWLTGEGYKLRDEVVEDGVVRYKKGERIGWTIKFLPVGDILNYPLRFNPDVSIVDTYSRNRVLHRFRVLFPTLAQVIHAVMWELSWGGNPKETEAFVDMIQEASDEKHMSEPIPADEYIERLRKGAEE